MTEPNAAEMPKSYNPKQYEEGWYRFWEDNGYFKPEINPEGKPFTIIMPPPNVTGELHIGHAVTAAIEDILTRWHRMMGDAALWLPGEDHAAIAAQNVVERELAKEEGKTRHDLGREAFLERMWEWTNRYRHVIADQHKRLGASCDWDRERFTMDPGPIQGGAHHLQAAVRPGADLQGERASSTGARAAPPPSRTWRWFTARRRAPSPTSGTRCCLCRRGRGEASKASSRHTCGGDHPAGDDPGRYGHRRASGGPALQGHDRQAGGGARR